MAVTKRTQEKNSGRAARAVQGVPRFAAVCLDSAARRCGAALKVLRSQNRALFWARN
jgi:hypothetical protein